MFYKTLCIFLKISYTEQSDILYMTQLWFVTENQKAIAVCGVSLLKPKTSGAEKKERTMAITVHIHGCSWRAC